MAVDVPPDITLDAVLRRAIAHHQAGNLTEAERLYRQIVVARPDFAEVRVNLGVVLMFQGNLDAAAAECRCGIALKPGYPKGHYYLGDILAFQDRFAEAAQSYRLAIALKSDYAEAWNNLGNVLMKQDLLDEAASAYHNVITLRSDIAEPHANLGNILARQERPEQAVECYRRAAAIRPGYVEALSNMGASLGKMGKLKEAEAACGEAIALKPDYAEAQCNLGNIYKEQGRYSEAEACYRRALQLKPGFSNAHLHLGAVLCESHKLDEGFACLTRYATLTYADGSKLGAGPLVAHKLKHDREQHAWLTGSEMTDGAAPDTALRLVDGNRLEGPAINPDNNVSWVSEQWRTARPQIVVIDDLLTPEALEKLRLFCMGSTFWRSVYEGGYLGAMPEHGFACPLLAQIGEELRAVFPEVIGDHPLLHLWAFKYDSSLRGINVHADFAAVNVNFWITPDEANLDPEGGGLKVWDVAAPLDWDFEKYNAADSDIRAFLVREGAMSVTIPYRANRAVVFDSDLFHETDTIRFKPGYENRRINITLLYGRRQAGGHG